MKSIRWLICCFMLSQCAINTGSGAERDLVTQFWRAQSHEIAEQTATDIVATEPEIEALYQALKSGPEYSAEVPRGQQTLYRQTLDGTQYPYVLILPQSYSPDTSYPVKFHLHGGVSRPPWQPGENWWRRGFEAYLELPQITVIPAAWNEHFWWQDNQAENIREILRAIKQIYNVDDNRVYLSGVSDGGTGAYFFAFKQPTEWAAYLPYIGNPAVLRNARSGAGHLLFFENLLDANLYIVNGENDPLYPASAIQPFVNTLNEANINHVFRVIDNGGHNTRWLAEETPAIDQFIADNPRDPLPDQITWVTDTVDRYNRYKWIQIDELSVPGRPGLLEVSRMDNQISVTTRQVDAFTLLLSPDEIDFSQPVTVSVNGVSRINGLLQPDVGTLLKWAKRDLDRTMLFTVELNLQVE